jgi:hypothetical protein
MIKARKTTFHMLTVSNFILFPFLLSIIVFYSGNFPSLHFAVVIIHPQEAKCSAVSEKFERHKGTF